MLQSRGWTHTFRSVAAVSAVLWASPVAAVPMLFTDEASFNAAAATAGISLATDGFEDLASGSEVSPIARPAFSLSQALGGAFGVEVTPSTFVIDGNVSVTTFSQSGPLIFDLSDPANAFALSLGDLDIGSGDVTLTVDAGSPLAVGLSAGLDQSLFLGVIDSDAAFSQISIDRTIDGEVYVFDSARYGTVPEPGTLILMFVGLVGLASHRLRSGVRL